MLTQMHKQRAKISELESIKTFLIGLKPPGLEQKAHQVLVEETNKTRDELQTLIIKEDTILVYSVEMFGLQQSCSRNSADSTDSRLTNIRKTLKKNSSMVKIHRTNKT